MKMKASIFQMIYFSQRAPDSGLSTVELSCEQAFKRNRADDISGLLVNNNQHFLQFIEEPCDEVRACLARIADDVRHFNVIVIWAQRSAERVFPDGAAMRIERGEHQRFASMLALADLTETDLADADLEAMWQLGSSKLPGFQRVAALRG